MRVAWGLFTVFQSQGLHTTFYTCARTSSSLVSIDSRLAPPPLAIVLKYASRDMKVAESQTALLHVLWAMALMYRAYRSFRVRPTSATSRW